MNAPFITRAIKTVQLIALDQGLLGDLSPIQSTKVKANKMKQSVNFSAFVDAFHAYERYGAFGYDALKLIFDYLEDYEEQTGEEIELDVIAICCDYAVSDWQTIANDYNIDLTECGDDDERFAAVIEYLQNNTQYLGECDAGLVYCSTF